MRQTLDAIQRVSSKFVICRRARVLALLKLWPEGEAAVKVEMRTGKRIRSEPQEALSLPRPRVVAPMARGTMVGVHNNIGCIIEHAFYLTSLQEGHVFQRGRSLRFVSPQGVVLW